MKERKRKSNLNARQEFVRVAQETIDSKNVRKKTDAEIHELYYGKSDRQAARENMERTCFLEKLAQEENDMAAEWSSGFSENAYDSSAERKKGIVDFVFALVGALILVVLILYFSGYFS